MEVRKTFTDKMQKGVLKNMKRKICTKQTLLDWGITVEETSEKGKYLVKRNGKKLTRHPTDARKKYGKTITYLYYSLYMGKVDGKVKQTNLLEHVAVWLWFKGDIPDGLDLDHIDNDKFNNDIDNLQLLTRKENLRKRGIGHNQYTFNLTDEEILALRKRNAEKHRKVN